MKNKLAIFDMDGTLFDSRDANFKAYQETLIEYGYQLDYEYFSEYCYGKHYQEFLAKIDDIKIEDIFDIHAKKIENYKKYLNCIKENKHLFDIIKLIKNEYYIALVTTASKENTEDILDFFNKREFFDLILTHSDVECSKPNLEGFNKAISYFKVEVGNTIIFEDSKVGVEAGRRCGAQVFIVDKF